MQKEALSVSANLVIKVSVDCPGCGCEIDLVKDTRLNQDGYVFQETISDEAWNKDSSERLDTDCMCPKCKTEFRIKGVVW